MKRTFWRNGFLKIHCVSILILFLLKIKMLVIKVIVQTEIK